jgi:8-oxo-dGTP pyrophosphatase MutT (NUDIX family)
VERDSLEAALAQRRRRSDARNQYAAVLVPIIDDGGPLRLLLTRRSEELPTHKGQVAFPGGRVEADDEGPVAAALRETYEEIGMAPEYVDVIGRLDDFPTVTDDMMVTPVVGWIRELPPLVAAEDEVARIFSIPIQALMESERWVTRHWDRGGKQYPVFYFDWDGETLWGLSAYITLQLLALLPAGPPIQLPAPYNGK